MHVYTVDSSSQSTYEYEYSFILITLMFIMLSEEESKNENTANNATLGYGEKKSFCRSERCVKVGIAACLTRTLS